MKKVILICGGPSSEYEISLLSSQAIINSIDYSKYSISICIIEKDRTCTIKELKKPEKIQTIKRDKMEFINALSSLKEYDLALLGTHGQFGEDGVLQTYLEQAGIPFTGSDSYSSRLCMDKYRSSIVVNSKLGIQIPNTKIVRLEDLKRELLNTSLPVFIKPNRDGSSVCSYILEDLSNLDSTIKDFYSHHIKQDEILIQELIDDNVEISCGCLEKKDHSFIQLPPIEIIPKNSTYFDYKSKYQKYASLERIPATGIDNRMRDTISKYAVEIHKLLGCSLYSRSDFLVKENIIYYLETNTLPGMTNTSLLPQETNSIGISFSELISFYIENS